jgi:hypothetical protein
MLNTHRVRWPARVDHSTWKGQGDNMIAHAIIAEVRPDATRDARAALEDTLTTASRATGFRGGLVLHESTRHALLLVVLHADGTRPDIAAYALEPHTVAAPVEREYRVALTAGQLGGHAARVFQPRFRPGSIDAVVGLFRNAVMHSATAQAGFRCGLLLVNEARDDVLSIGLWESFDALRASEQVGYLREQVVQFAAHLEHPPQPWNCDVTQALRARDDN